jgi:oligopeptide/dipeptide ABC transporter ATP-binding protein
MATALVELQSVSKRYRVERGLLLGRTLGTVTAVDRVSLSLQPEKTVSVVGESGCGKSTLSRLILGIESPSAGRVLFEGADLHLLSRERTRDYRDAVQAVFQDPWSSLDPRMTVGASIGEPLAIRGSVSKAAQRERVAALLVQVGLKPEHADRYPHEFSGGQRQRIAVARALALQPRLVVLDEPVSALDVSIRAQILNLLIELQERYGLAYLLISHHLATVWSLSDLVVVMYMGKLVEVGLASAVRDRPLHPYTQALIAATPPPHPDMKRIGAPISGEIPSPFNPPAGCRFHTRCPRVMARCRGIEPELREIEPGRFVACHLY